MKILFVYRSEPDDVTKTLAQELEKGNEKEEFKLYEPGADYEKLLDMVFDADKVVTWW